MKIKVSEATGSVLDWMVAEAEGHDAAIDGYGCIIRHNNVIDRFEPSTNWGWGGPIIEREKITVGYEPGPGWQAIANPENDEMFLEWGLTPLIAAMRCFVSSKLGEEVDVPEELA